jgi:hypothetical protein
MNKEELENRLLTLFTQKSNSIVEQVIQKEGYNPNQYVGEGIYTRVANRAAIEWDNYLNKLDIKRREYHLKEKEPDKDRFRINDTFHMGGHGGRWLDIPLYLVNRILVLGLP